MINEKEATWAAIDFAKEELGSIPAGKLWSKFFVAGAKWQRNRDIVELRRELDEREERENLERYSRFVQTN